MKDNFDVDVLIVGAGASGLTLAIELARRGASFRLIDQAEAPFAGSRGQGIQPRSLEIFEDLEVVDRLCGAGHPYPPHRTYRPDGTVEESQGIAVDPPTDQEPYRTPLMLAQFRTEGILRERLAELGGPAVQYGLRLSAFSQGPAGVTAEISGRRPERVRCRYLIGCDGGRSFVRQTLAIGFPGQTLGQRAIVADLALEGLGRDAWHRFNDTDRGRQVWLCPLAGTSLFQLQAPVAAAGEIDMAPAGIQTFLDERVPGRGLVVRDVAWASAYEMNARLADTYRAGRVFLVGDAAHVHPPTGGQGLNTSVQDAYNLGWKLAAVLSGAAQSLLDSYEEERRPIAAGVLGLSTTLLDRARGGDMKRGREAHQLDLNYRGSSLAAETAHRGPVRAGDRAPDARLVGAGGQARRLFDLMRGPHWTLVVRGDGTAPTSRPGLRVFRIGEDMTDPDGQMGRVYGLAEGDAVLIRPDGYLGMVASASEQSILAAYLARMGIG